MTIKEFTSNVFFLTCIIVCVSVGIMTIYNTLEELSNSIIKKRQLKKALDELNNELEQLMNETTEKIETAKSKSDNK